MPPRILQEEPHGTFSYRNWTSSSLDIPSPARVYDPMVFGV